MKCLSIKQVWLNLPSHTEKHEDLLSNLRVRSSKSISDVTSAAGSIHRGSPAPPDGDQ